MIFIIALFLSGCSQQINTSKEQIAFKCTKLCQSKINTQDLNNGLCLGLIDDGWVCDVAHNPRQAIDNLPENQCIDYREGRARHFVEVDPECKIIREL